MPAHARNIHLDVFSWLHQGQDYKNVFVDGITEISELFVEELNKQFPNRADAFPMWGEYAKKMRSVIKNFRDLPYNVFITVVSEVDKDENNKRFMGFQVAGSISKKLPQYFDEVFFVHVNAEGKRTLVTQATDTIIAKDRSNKLNAVEEPNLAEILAKINKKESKE